MQQMSKLARLASIAATNAFVRCVRWAGTLAGGGRRTMHNALMRRCVTMSWYMSPQKGPFPVPI